MTADPTPQPEPDCCGLGRPAGWDKVNDPKGDRILRQACQLCEHSPTHWDPDGAKRARLVELYGE